MKCFILGSGSFAAALAYVLGRNGCEVDLWCRRSERRREIDGGRHGYLPDVELPSSVHGVPAGRAPAEDYDLAISVVPTQKLRQVIQAHSGDLPRGLPWVSASKGVEIGTFLLPSAILRESGVCASVAVLSGPSHAEEVAREVPTAVVLADDDVERARRLQQVFAGESFRVYVNDDPTGVEWGGALKNVIAVASGIAIGYGFGDNTLAALITRGAVEIARLGVALGGRRETFYGLSGIGDLIVTCFSEHSRNRRFGFQIGRGGDPRRILEESSQVVEGAHTCDAVARKCPELEIEMPITEEVQHILAGRKGVEEGIQSLLQRSLKAE